MIAIVCLYVTLYSSLLYELEIIIKYQVIDEILDKIEPIVHSKKIFSKLSFVAALIDLGCLLYLFLNMPETIKASEGFPEIPLNIIRVT